MSTNVAQFVRRITDSRAGRGDAATRAALQDLLVQDAATSTEWLLRRQAGPYSDDLVQRQRALAYIQWCTDASDTLQR